MSCTHGGWAVKFQISRIRGMKREGPDQGQETTGTTVAAMATATAVVMVGRRGSSAIEAREQSRGRGGGGRGRVLDQSN